jgi:beta-phosphoglucomutase-like phosphatase (HAD superfamily)
VPVGTPGDPPHLETAHGLFARQRQLFDGDVAAHGVTVYPTAVALLTRLRDDGVRTALVTPSRHSHTLLSAGVVINLSDVRVDGSDAARQGLPASPHPAMLLEAAHRLGVPPDQSIVVVDNERGVAAGLDGQFGLVVGVDRLGNRTQLLQAELTESSPTSLRSI